MKAALLKAAGGHLDGLDFDRIDQLNTKRNKIVHEWSQEKVGRDQLTSYYDSVHALIEAFARACRADGSRHPKADGILSRDYRHPARLTTAK